MPIKNQKNLGPLSNLPRQVPTAEELSKLVAEWVTSYGFSPSVKMERVGDSHKVSFRTTTTTSRASHIVTRISLIVAELSFGRPHSVGKTPLRSSPPITRGSLLEWEIWVEVPVARRIVRLRAAS